MTDKLITFIHVLVYQINQLKLVRLQRAKTINTSKVLIFVNKTCFHEFYKFRHSGIIRFFSLRIKCITLNEPNR